MGPREVLTPDVHGPDNTRCCRAAPSPGSDDTRRCVVRRAFDCVSGLTPDLDLDALVFKLGEVRLPDDGEVDHCSVEDLRLLVAGVGPDLELGDVVYEDTLAGSVTGCLGTTKETDKNEDAYLTESVTRTVFIVSLP